MTQEKKELLLKDLYARLPYGVKVSLGLDRTRDYIEPEADTCLTLYYINPQRLECVFKECWWTAYIGAIKPYLRPMLSMTEEEREELKQLSDEYLEEWTNAQTPIDKWKLDGKISYNRSVFYNSHHLDWNDLIEKGLALEAPKDLYSNESEYDENEWKDLGNGLKVNRLGHVELTEEERKRLEDSMYDENGWKHLGNGLKMDKDGHIAGGLKFN